jgi:hypothetical protein
MNKEIREILELAAQLDKALNYKLADSLTGSLIKLAKGLQLQQVKIPTQFQSFIPKSSPVVNPVSPVMNFSTAPTSSIPKSSPSVVKPVSPVLNFSTGPKSSIEDIKKHNEGVELTKLPENENVVDRANKKLKSRVEEQAKKAVKIWKLVKKPNNIYSDYVSNSKDIKLKDYNKKIQSLTENDIKSYIENLIYPTFWTDEVKPKTEAILGWAFKMHIINYIPPEVNISFSRSAVKPGQNVDVKKSTKIEVKTKTQGRSLPTMPTLPTTTPERVEEKTQEEKKETTTSPVLKPFVEPAPLLSPTISPMISTPMRTKFLPEESPELLTTKIMTPILSPKREEETTYGPMNWNEFLNSLNPNMPSAQAPINTTNQSSQTANPSNQETKPPAPPAQPPSKKQDEEPKTRTVLPFDMKVPETGFATPGGISYMKSF